MSIPILSTKLHIPASRAQVVARPHLLEQLKTGLSCKLILVSAPAGFGKTTLISEWVNTCECPTAWLSLDEGDDDPNRFLIYLIAALQTIDPRIGEQLGSLLQSPQPPPMQSLITILINELSTLPDNVVLVLDDYHILDSQPIDEALSFLLDHMPPQMHLVLTTREDPPFPLARLRARGQLLELRAADLRFSVDEAAEFLNQVMNLNLSPQNIAALETRTEGWVAGLQLAALSMQGQTDISGFIESFTGTHHFVLDYLLEEVLHRQPESVQNFLLQTAILDRLSGSLCDAVLNDAAISGQSALEYLAGANLFLVPLDNERWWYRYHHLFGDLLRQRLQQRLSSAEVAALHARASQWYEDNGFEIDAFHHATYANDIARAERLIEGNGIPLVFRGILTPVLNWLESLPITTLDAKPSLWVTYASALTILGHPAPVVETKLQAAESAIGNPPFTDKDRDLIGQVAANRAMLGVPQGQIQTIITQSHRALEYLHPDNLSLRTTTTWTLGLAYQLLGDRAAARQAYTEALAISEKSGNTMIILATATGLGKIHESENQLHQAAEAYQQVLAVLGDPPPPYACEAYLGLARIHYQWDDLETAQTEAEKSLRLARQLPNVDTPAACGIFLIHLKLACGDINGANEMYAQTHQFIQQQHFEQWTTELIAAQVLILLHEGNLTAAAHTAQNLPLCQARVHLAQRNPAAALALLEPLYQQALSNERVDEQLETLILQALARQALGETETATQTLENALALAKPSGFIRIFIDEGLPMAELLTEVAALGILPHYTNQLLSAFEAEALPPKSHLEHPDLIEPLTSREQDVLRLIVAGYSNPDIAEELVIAVTTVKTHAKNIYGKLQVDNRYQAISRAKDLDLV